MKKLALVFVVLALAVLPLRLRPVARRRSRRGPSPPSVTAWSRRSSSTRSWTQARRSTPRRQGAPPFPEEGTAQYNQLKASIVTYLVQNEIVEQQADDMSVSVTDKELQDRMKQIVQQSSAARRSSTSCSSSRT